MINDRALLLLALLYLSGRTIIGTKRLQKLALFASKELQRARVPVTYFDDWKADKYGGLSVLVYETKDELAAKGLISEGKSKIGQFDANVYSLTDKAIPVVQSFLDTRRDVEKVMRNVSESYKRILTEQIVADSYQQFPELSIHSKIKPEVNRSLLKKTFLSSDYEEDIGPMPSASSQRKKDSARSAAEEARLARLQEFQKQPLPDIEARKRMASLAGLTKLPDLDPFAIYRLSGIVKKELDVVEEYDAVDLVRSVRGQD